MTPLPPDYSARLAAVMVFRGVDRATAVAILDRADAPDAAATAALARYEQHLFTEARAIADGRVGGPATGEHLRVLFARLDAAIRQVLDATLPDGGANGTVEQDLARYEAEVARADAAEAARRRAVDAEPDRLMALTVAELLREAEAVDAELDLREVLRASAEDKVGQ